MSMKGPGTGFLFQKGMMHCDTSDTSDGISLYILNDPNTVKL